MPAAPTRQTTLTIDLGDGQFLLERVEAVESLGRPFVVTVDLFSKLGEIDILPHLGKPAVVAVSQDDVLLRQFHGIVVEGEYLSERTEGFHYRVTLRPWTHLLSQNRNFAIHQNKTAIAVVKETLKDFPFAHIDYGSVDSGLREREYTVQYGESDFAFITRLLEEEGIYYYFDHGESKHEMILCNGKSPHPAGDPATFVFNPATAGIANVDSDDRHGGSRYLSRWNERVVSGAEGKVTMRDFDFKKPGSPVESVSEEKSDHPLDQLEIYQWPGNFVTKDEGGHYAKMLLESRRGGRRSYSAETQRASIACGRRFTLDHEQTDRFDTDYVITRTHHVLTAEQHRSGGGSGGGEHLVHFEAIRADARWHAPITSPRPVVRGPETAIVTGPRGEEIYCDEYARIKVRFHWDRAQNDPEKSTCWIRVSQTGGLGNLILPRVGHEVVVDFLDGDPDRPLVMGRVFNEANQPVYKLPANKTRMLWRSASYKESGSYGAAEKLDTGEPRANEIRFEDMGGKEEFFMHAERDMNTRIRHKETHHVGLDQDNKIGGSRTTKIKETDTLDVGKSIKIDAGTTIDITAKTSITFTVGQSKIVMKPESISFKSIMSKAEATATLDVKSPMTTVKGDGMLTLKGGMTMINC